MDADRVVVITGAGGGMGLACIPNLAADAWLLLVDRSDDELAQALETATAAGGSATAVPCDVTSAPDVTRLADAIRDAGPLAAIVHAVGISPQMADGRTILDVDLIGTARVLDAIEPLVQPGTAAVCIASIAGHSDTGSEVNTLLEDPLAPTFLDDVEATLAAPLTSDTGYVLAKRGVIRLCERLAGPWGPKGGRLVSISPGLVDTGRGRLELDNQPIMQTMVDLTPVKRAGTSTLPGRVEDVADLVAFLCSERASFISGCDIRLDGGLVGATRHLGFGA